MHAKADLKRSASTIWPRVFLQGQVIELYKAHPGHAREAYTDIASYGDRPRNRTVRTLVSYPPGAENRMFTVAG